MTVTEAAAAALALATATSTAMSARRDGQQNAAASESVTKTDFMLKIMTAMPASTATAIATVAAAAAAMPTATSTSATTVNVQNKCATAAPTTFSYQRAAKRCARLPQTTKEANNAAPSPTTTATVTESITDSETAKTTTTAAALSFNSCERQRRLAAHKAQLRAAFFKDLNALALQQQQQQQQQPREPREQLREPASTQRIQQLIEKFETMIVQQPTEQRSNEAQTQMQTQTHTQTPMQAQQSTSLLLKPGTILSSIANSDEGCNAGGLSPCSSDNECDAAATARLSKPKVTRCASSDSALGLEVDDVTMAEMPPAMPQRRMTLTVTDLPLRPALLPLAEPTALPDSPLTSPTNATSTPTTPSTLTPTSLAAGVGAGANAGVPSKVLLEERVVAAPPSSRRESTQSCISELGGLAGVRYVRTPSVVVSDYSDDITACGISMEEMEYFRLQRARCQRRCSLEASAAAAGGIGGAKDEAQSDVSAASSCSNLYYCGSTISALDGGECIVNGVRVALARKSSHSSSGDLSDEELPSAAEAEEEAELQQQKEQQQQQLERERERERQLSELLAATQLGEGFKKVGSDGVNSGGDDRSRKQQQEGGGGDKGKVTIMGNLN